MTSCSHIIVKNLSSLVQLESFETSSIIQACLQTSFEIYFLSFQLYFRNRLLFSIQPKYFRMYGAPLVLHNRKNCIKCVKKRRKKCKTGVQVPELYFSFFSVHFHTLKKIVTWKYKFLSYTTRECKFLSCIFLFLNTFYSSAFGCKGYCQSHGGWAGGWSGAEKFWSKADLSPYYTTLLKLDITCRSDIVDVHGMLILTFQWLETFKLALPVETSKAISQ